MILLIDNYDSFTYNLLHYTKELGVACVVHRNDKLSLKDIKDLNPRGIIISPGPGTPDDSGICLDVVKKLIDMPIFGVCLGHQVIGQVMGGKVVRAPVQMHGKVSNIEHTGKSVFEGLPSPFIATRYHSLIVERETLPTCLDITAQTSDGLVMGLTHKERPLHGVQFHPESIRSEHGHHMIANFLRTAGLSPNPIANKQNAAALISQI